VYVAQNDPLAATFHIIQVHQTSHKPCSFLES
jgi:hypothetical protein